MKAVVMLILVILGLSTIWELSHSILYDWDKEPLKDQYFKRISMSILGDVIILSIIFFFVLIIGKNPNLLTNPKTRDILLVALLGLIFATLIELRALSQNKWAYTSAMPTIFGIGLTPLIQLASTGIASLYLTKFFLKI